MDGGQDDDVFLWVILRFPYDEEGGFGFGGVVALGLELGNAFSHGIGKGGHVCSLWGDEVAIGVA